MESKKPNIVLFPELIWCIHHFQYNARENDPHWVGFESGAEIKPNIPPHTHFTTFEALDRCDTIKDKAHMTVFLQSDTTAPVFFNFYFCGLF